MPNPDPPPKPPKPRKPRKPYKPRTPPPPEITDMASATNEVLSAITHPVDHLPAESVAFPKPESSGEKPESNSPYQQPWDRLSNESQYAWFMFSHFRDEGVRRTVISTVRWSMAQPDPDGEPVTWTQDKQRSRIRRYSDKHRWRERTFAYDKETERLYQLARSEGIREMAERHTDVVMGAIQNLQVPGEALRLRIETDPNFLTSLSQTSIKQLISLVNQTTRTIPALLNAERLVRGMPTEIVGGVVEHQHVVSVEQSQIGAILDVLAAAGRLDDGSSDRGSGEIVDAEVVEVHSLPAEGDDGSGDSGDNPETDGVPPS